LGVVDPVGRVQPVGGNCLQLDAAEDTHFVVPVAEAVAVVVDVEVVEPAHNLGEPLGVVGVVQVLPVGSADQVGEEGIVPLNH